MRSMMAAAALAVLAVGCDTKSQATGREFMEKFQKAEKAKDSEAIWGMLTKDSRDSLIASAKAEKGTPDKSKSGDSDEKLGRDKLAKQLEGRSTPLLNGTYVEERSQGDQIILVVEVEGKNRKEIPLVREGGSLRIRWDDKSGL